MIYPLMQAGSKCLAMSSSATNKYSEVELEGPTRERTTVERRADEGTEISTQVARVCESGLDTQGDNPVDEKAKLPFYVREFRGLHEIERF